jgi:glycosyltransferase involved in cell wall biosynthesis
MDESSFTPLVSIIVPAFNAEKTISDTIASIVKQTYNKLEIIIVDDGSTDRTAEIVQSIAIKDHRIQLIKQQNAGVAQARNTAYPPEVGHLLSLLLLLRCHLDKKSHHPVSLTLPRAFSQYRDLFHSGLPLARAR